MVIGKTHNEAVESFKIIFQLKPKGDTAESVLKSFPMPEDGSGGAEIGVNDFQITAKL